MPVIGAVAVTFLVTKFAPEANGHGVPEVMDAIYYNGGVIRPVVAVVKSLASAIAIGSGAAVGREGPIIQIGSALGSTLGQIIRMPPGQRITLVAAGAGAGIAATFNTPIGGVPVRDRTDDAGGQRPHFPAGGDRNRHGDLRRPLVLRLSSRPSWCRCRRLDRRLGAALLLFLYAILGVITGARRDRFIRGLHFSRICSTGSRSRYARHMLGMLLVGILIYLLQQSFGHYYVEGVGYATIQAIVFGQLNAAWLLGAAVRLQAVRHDRRASGRARRAGSSRPRSSWARRSAARSRRR